MATTTKVGARWTRSTRRAKPSTKKSKAHEPTFGTSSMFKGIGRGVKGDSRK